MTTYTPTPQRASGGTDIEISIGMLTMRYDLVPVDRSKKSADTALKMVCDKAHDDGHPAKLDQQYVCSINPGEHGTYTQGDAPRARPVEDEDGNTTLVIVDKDAIADAKAGGKDTGILDLAVHPADEVADACRTGAKCYRLRPGRVKGKVPPKSIEMYGVLRAFLAANPGITLCGELLLKGARSFYMLDVWGDQLTLQQLTHPADLAERDVIAVDPDPAVVDKMGQLLGTYLVPFDPELHYYDAKTAIDDVAAVAAGEQPTLAPVAEVVDIGAFLASALDARRTEQVAV